LPDLIDQLDLDPAMVRADAIRRRVFEPLQAWQSADFGQRDRQQLREVSRFIDALLPTLVPALEKQRTIRRRAGPSRADRISTWLARTKCVHATAAVTTKSALAGLVHREFCKSGTVVSLSYFVNVLKKWDVSRKADLIIWTQRRDNEDKPG
jgi:hypothetical protein